MNSAQETVGTRNRKLTTMTCISFPVSILPNVTISKLKSCKTMKEFHQIHAYMIKTNLVNDTITISKLISFCSLSGLPNSLAYSSSVFSRVQNPNEFMFHALINDFGNSGNPLECVFIYVNMLYCLNDLNKIVFSLPSVLKACGKLSAIDVGKQFFGQILKAQLWFDPFVSNSLVRMFLQVGEFELARTLFDKMPERDLISWNSMITGYLRVGEIDSAKELFEKMPERDLVSYNVMIDGYGKCGRCDLAEGIFITMKDKDVISWTSMISAYVVGNHPSKALGLFREMLNKGIKPDVPAIVCVLAAIAELGFVEEGKWVHAYILANKIKLRSGYVGSALIDMYSKCGCIDVAYDIFKQISDEENIGTWNSMITGLAVHGLSKEAVRIFHEMEMSNIKPDEITFLGLLTACSHGGLVNEGRFYFKIMQEKYQIIPKIQHYGCLVDINARAGHLSDALDILQCMPMEADALAWKAVLSASLKLGNVEIGEKVALKAIELDPKDSSSYVLLSNIYAKTGRWDDVTKVRDMMVKRGVQKIPGCSSIVVEGKLYQFLAAKEIDRRQSKEILSKLEELVCRLKLEGYEPDLNQVLLNVEEDRKENLLSFHSEKMALAFGLINSRCKGAPIQIVKNLRICSDCHSFMKLASRVYRLRIIVRDQNRFHHFENGSCSCGDYW